MEGVFHGHIFIVDTYKLYVLVGYSDQSANRFENRPTKAWRATVNSANTKSDANIKSIFARPLARSIKNPKPLDDPTHSPITAPMGAYTAANRNPDPSEGKAAGRRKRKRV
jgi:hypothetical protein